MKKGTPSSVTVAVRVRPLNDREKLTPEQTFALDLGETFVSLPNDATYVFDAVFGPDHSTQDLYDAVAEPIVSSSLAGINGTIFAYGQTASGKTFSMQGSETEPGILRLAARQLFEVATNAQWTYTFVVSYVEIYNERVKDLMSTATGKFAQDAASDLKIREDRQNGFYVDGVVERAVADYESLIELFEEGEKRRHVAGTDMNLKSSRSHTIFTINVTAKQKPNETGDFAFGTLKSRLSLVDLAGSESARLTNAEGERLKEGAQINKSLLALSLVISSLAKTNGKDAHVKFRDSKLTQILQPSLAGNCRTAVVCCVTPAASFLSETCSTLKFASSAKHIQTQYVVNQIADVSRSIKSYQDQLEQLSRSLREEQLARSIAERAAEKHGAEQFIELETKVKLLEEKADKLKQERDSILEALQTRESELTALQELVATRHAEALEMLEKEKERTVVEIEAQRQDWETRLMSMQTQHELSLAEMISQVQKERDARNKYVEEIRSELESKVSSLSTALEETRAASENERRVHQDEVAKLLIEWQNRLSKTQHDFASKADEELHSVEAKWQSSVDAVEARLQIELSVERAKADELLSKLSKEEHTRIQLQNELGILEASKADVQRKLDLVMKEMSEVQTKCSEMESKHAIQFTTLQQELNEQQQAFSVEVQRLKQEHNSLTAQLQDNFSNELGQERKRWELKVAELQESHADFILAANREAEVHYEAKLGALQNECDIKMDLLIKEELAKRERLQKEMQQLLDNSGSSLKELMQEKQNLQRMLHDLERVLSNEREALSQTKMQLGGELLSCQETLRELAIEKEMLHEKVKLTEESRVRAEEHFNELVQREQLRFEKVRQELETNLKSQKQVSEESTSSLEDLSSKMNAEKKKVLQLELSLKEMRASLNIANEQISSLRAEKERIREEFSFELDALKTETEHSEESQVSRLKGELADSKRQVQLLNRRLTDFKKLHEEAMAAKEDEKDCDVSAPKKDERAVTLTSEAEQHYMQQITELHTKLAHYESKKLTREQLTRIKQVKEENDSLKAKYKELEGVVAKLQGFKARQLKSAVSDGLSERNENVGNI